MIDIHCHILPGIDDGAKTSGDTLTMLKSAIDEGITTITATPHHNPQFNNCLLYTSPSPRDTR